MPAARSRDELVAAIDDAFGSVSALCASLTEEQWATPTDVPGWDVKDNVSHLLGTEAMLVGRPSPEIEVPDLPHLKNDIAKFNEVWVHERRPRTGAEVLAEYDEIVAERKQALAAMDQAAFDEESFTPAGQDTYGRFMQVRVFDCWIHEQDIRTALDLPGHHDGPAIEVAIDELTTAMGFVVGKKAGAADGQSVRIALTGPTSRDIHVAVDGRAAVVPSLDGEPTATVTVPTTTWFRFISGRWPADADHPDVALSGDLALARRVVTAANYTI